ATRLREIERRFRQGDWTDSGRFDGQVHGEIYGKTLGLVGYGHIGRETARRARAFGMRVAAVGRRPRTEPELDWYGTTRDLDQLIEMSDFVAIVCPLTDETRGLIDEARLRRLKPTAFLVNVARAEIVQQEPLYRALRERWFAGAALDVWYDYPPAPAVRQHGSKLPFHELDHVLLTPHSSAWTEPLLQRRLARIAENLDRLARGERLDRIVYEAPAAAAAG
ncbi:MAG TPA: NAD(P)-dependent oxidoreductase, partial [Phycisphaerae bacterium]|nr:NAD(P)-dependent oxidoreductase [Phycisphaerae bacterium]